MFTKQEIEEIRNKLQAYSKKDTDFDPVGSIGSDDQIAFVQKTGQNTWKNIRIPVTTFFQNVPEIKELLNKVAALETKVNALSVSLDSAVSNISALTNKVTRLETTVASMQVALAKAVTSPNGTIKYIEWVTSEPTDPNENTLYIIKNCN